MSSPVEHSHRQLEMHLEQNKYADTKLSISRQKKIEELFEKDVFKVITPEEVLSNTQVVNFLFINNIKDSCTNKANKKSCLVMHAYNNLKKNLMLIHSLKIRKIS